jgi:excinuclease ABC subunit C
VNKVLQKKLAKLPKTPGVYFHKNAKGEIIYIGKAANLKNRVRQYFQSSRYRDPKTDALVAEIADVDWTELESEADALFLEAELVRRYLPDYNILLRDDKSLQFVRIDIKSDHPTVSVVRRPLDDKAEYFGPYLSGFALKKALRHLRKAFPYSTGKTSAKRASLHYHLGLDPGLEDGRTSIDDYRANLRKLMQYLRGNRVALMSEIEGNMKKASKAKDFESAAKLRNQLFALRSLNKQILFGDRELQDASKDLALAQLGKILGIEKALRRIEGYDISHQQGTDTVASMVVFSSGVPEKTAYRKFKMRIPGNDDFAHINEALTRRLSATNQKRWGLADLLLIDGGKGQLGAAISARDGALLNLPMIGLAKREEEIIVHKTSSHLTINGSYIKSCGGFVAPTSSDFVIITLPLSSPAVKLLQRIRDESHRFAVSYHTSLKRSRQTASSLDGIPGIGSATRKKLIRVFGSARAARNAPIDELNKVVSTKVASLISAEADK